MYRTPLAEGQSDCLYPIRFQKQLHSVRNSITPNCTSLLCLVYSLSVPVGHDCDVLLAGMNTRSIYDGHVDCIAG